MNMEGGEEGVSSRFKAARRPAKKAARLSHASHASHTTHSMPTHYNTPQHTTTLFPLSPPSPRPL